MSYITGIRERPPLRLSVDAKTPAGRHTRWGWDEPEPENVPGNLSFSTVMPGGFERFSCTLERDSRLFYADTEELATITAQGAGGQVAWQGRLEKNPDTGGFQQQEQPEAVGWQAHLEDNQSARTIIVDQELAKWQAASTSRKIQLLNAPYNIGDGSVGAGPTLPALITSITGPWTRLTLCEAWYDARGIPLGALKYLWKLREAGKIGDDVTTDANWAWGTFLSSDEVASTLDTSGNLRSEGPTGTGTVSATGTRLWGLLQLYFNGAAGTDGVEYPVYWPRLAVYGNHGLPLYGALTENTVPGVLASDAAAYFLSQWAPKLAYTTGPEGTIRPSSFVLEQLAMLDPTTVAEMLKLATRYELLDWAVWEGPTYYQNDRGARGKHWRARVGPAQLQQTGPQVSRLWNGVVVSYNDVTGATRTIGPVGSGTNAVSSLLQDFDPENPLNQAGIPKYAPLKMGTSTQAGAEQVGARFLQESKTLDSSGQATLVGYVEDESGVTWPAWMVRAGDTVSFVDAADPSPRRIVHTQYEDSTKSNALQLDQPPDSMTALLERLSVALVPLGLS